MAKKGERVKGRGSQIAIEGFFEVLPRLFRRGTFAPLPVRIQPGSLLEYRFIDQSRVGNRGSDNPPQGHLTGTQVQHNFKQRIEIGISHSVMLSLG